MVVGLTPSILKSVAVIEGSEIASLKSIVIECWRRGGGTVGDVGVRHDERCRAGVSGKAEHVIAVGVALAGDTDFVNARRRRLVLERFVAPIGQRRARGNQSAGCIIKLDMRVQQVFVLAGAIGRRASLQGNWASQVRYLEREPIGGIGERKY